MKHFWALPAVLRLAIASQHNFNVYDDVLAHPQYEVVMAEGILSEKQAQDAMNSLASRHSADPTEPYPTPQTSLHDPNTNTKSSRRHDQDDILSYENMILNNRRYLCSIPKIPVLEDKTNNTNISPEDEEKEVARATSHGSELLRSMDGNCLYFYSGWWSYSFCYGEGVRQFHQLPPGRGVPIYPPVEDKNVEAYILGRFEDPQGGKSKGVEAQESAKGETVTGKASETGLAKLETKGDVRYLVQHLRGGTFCGLAGTERRVEVQFRCQPNTVDKIALIKETTTCAYLMIIDTPRLCSDVAFLPPQETKPYAIACTPVLAESAIPSYLAAKESSQAAVDAEDDRLTQEVIDAVNLLETGQVPLGRYEPRIVGGIEIGGHSFIPKDRKLEKGVIVGGGREEFLATIARKDGYIASEKDLKKLGIKGGSEHVRELKEQVEREARDNSWRLDVVKTPRGFELRGIIEKDNDDDAGNDQQQQQQQQQQEEEESRHDQSNVPQEEQDQEGGSEETYKDEL